MNIVLLGPQGSGKGTQAKLVAADLEIPHISTGDMFRAAIADRTPLGIEVKAVLDAGELVSDEMTTDLVIERLCADDARGGFILDGFPRNLPQAAALDAWLAMAGRPLHAVLSLELSDEVATERMLARAAAEGRADDTPETITRRLEIYHQQTAPLVEHYRAGGTLVAIAADAPVQTVHAQIAARLHALGAGRQP